MAAWVFYHGEMNVTLRSGQLITPGYPEDQCSYRMLESVVNIPKIMVRRTDMYPVRRTDYSKKTTSQVTLKKREPESIG